jgi:exopolysaccharide production protein ExoZ
MPLPYWHLAGRPSSHVTRILFNRWWALALAGLYVVAFCLRPFGPIFEFLGNPIIIEFLFGVAITRAPKLGIGVAAIPVGAALLLLAGVLGFAPVGGTLDFLRGDDNLRRVFVCGIPAAIIVYGTMQIRTTPSVWTYLGDASYSLYLVHTFMVTPLQALWTKFPIPADAIIAIGLTTSVLFAWRVHELVEKPMLSRLARRPPVEKIAEIE